MLVFVLNITALVLGALALAGVASRFNLVAAGVVCLAAAQLLPRLGVA